MAARKLRATFFYVVFTVFFLAFLSLRYLHPHPPVFPLPTISATVTSTSILNRAVNENLTHPKFPPQLSSLHPSTLSLLLPDWEVLLVVSPDHTPALINPHDYSAQYFCLFPNKDFSPAQPAGLLPFPDRAIFKCLLPKAIRQRFPFPNPVLTKNPTPSTPPPQSSSPAPEMLRWTYVAYDSLTTEDDVIVFAKGLNNRQGVNRDPSGLNCVFYQGDDVDNAVRTAVTNSMQEVFRCQRPELTALPLPAGPEQQRRVKVTLETVRDKRVLPTVAYYTRQPRKLADDRRKALLCATTMVHNVAKYLKEWVMYHSRIGVEKFVLYDNGSDDDLQNVVVELIKRGYDVKTYPWFWPKTQEAGFSHSAVYTKHSCTWTAYIDIDEFIYSPSKSSLHSVLEASLSLTGQVHIGCHEFGPSNQTEHPPQGVIQGYNCRKRHANRHKSIVLLDAVDESLVNAIHHFKLKPEYKSRKFSIREMKVNHYKFQAWPEFKAKFRRRVSAYVADWTQEVNPQSNDRTPGLGFSAVEPQGWPAKFCEVVDNGLKDLTIKWFALQSSSPSPSGYKMAWQT